MGYTHLILQERIQLQVMLQQGKSRREIARVLNRSASTISREVKRQASASLYDAAAAQAQATRGGEKARRPEKMADLHLTAIVEEKLREKWSPEQIAGRLPLDFPQEPKMRISPETIYRYIYAQQERGHNLLFCLRQGHSGPRKRRHKKCKYQRIKDLKGIDQRPGEVDQRSRLGDWESDTLCGPSREGAGIATHVERKTRYLVAAKLDHGKAAEYNQKTIQAFRALQGVPVHTMTVDHGMEFASFKELEKSLPTAVYFAQPYHAWERGLNENTNGLLRQYFPKGKSLSDISQEELNEVEKQLNHRPRKCLGYRTPAEALAQAMGLKCCTCKLNPRDRTFAFQKVHEPDKM